MKTSPAENWLSFGSKDLRLLSQKITRDSMAHLKAKGMSERDVEYVSKLRRDLSPTGLDVDDRSLELLRRLCQHWDLELKPSSSITSHRKFVGPAIVLAKRILFPMLRFLMKDTFRQQRDFNLAAIELFSSLANRTKCEAKVAGDSAQPSAADKSSRAG